MDGCRTKPADGQGIGSGSGMLDEGAFGSLCLECGAKGRLAEGSVRRGRKQNDVLSSSSSLVPPLQACWPSSTSRIPEGP